MMTERRDDDMSEAVAVSALGQPWQLCLYVAGPGALAERALANVRDCCEQHLAGHYLLEVVDVQLHPQLARREQLLALPTLVRRLPSPRHCLVGDLSNAEQLLRSLTADAGC